MPGSLGSLLNGDIYRLLVEQARDYAVFALTPEGIIATWNVGAERLKGYRPDDIIGQHFSRFYTEVDLARGWPARELQIAAAEGRLEDEGWRVRKDGSRFWANVVITALRDEAGRLVGFSKITRDLTSRWQAEDALRQSEERFRLLVEGVTDYAIYMLDVDGRITSWNGGAERITGYKRDEIVGEHFSIFYDEDSRGTAPWEELATARSAGRAETEGWRKKKNGERFWARVVVTALHDGEGRLRGFAKVTQDLSDRRHIQSLEQAARHVSEFIAVLAHELRNPLTPIRSAAQLMLRLPPTHPSHPELRAMIDRQSAQLQRIVDDMIDMARISRGTLGVERVPCDLLPIIAAALDTSRPLIERKGHRLIVTVPPVPVPINADAHRLTQLLANLLNNSARYTPAGGSIEVRATTTAAQVEVEVIDTGPGVEPEMHDRIFDMFVRGRAQKSSDSGLGVGLALSRRIAELHDGSLEVRSEGAGRGATFALHLPLATAAIPAATRDAEVTGAPRRRILIVDDNPDAARSLELLLQDLGQESMVVHRGADALEMLPRHDPDVVLIDLGMPEMDGYELARRIRAGDLARQPRLIAVTGWGQDDDRARARDAGFDDHLVKPVVRDVLGRAVAPGR